MRFKFNLEKFEGSARQSGVRYWIAHEFMEALGYEHWSSFPEGHQQGYGVLR
jgi:DNA-damage-inducible protein D